MRSQSMRLEDGTVQWRVIDDDDSVLEYGIETTEIAAGLRGFQAMKKILRQRRGDKPRRDAS